MEKIKKIIEEAIRILEDYNPQSMRSRDESRFGCIDFLKVNFNIGKERSDEWKIEQFNRNRAIEDQVSTIGEMESRVKEIFNENT